MTPMAGIIPGGPEVLILIVIALALVVFGGSRLAGIGKGTGKAIREFKEETQTLGEKKSKGEPEAPASSEPRPDSTAREDVVEAEVVDSQPTEPRRDA